MKVRRLGFSLFFPFIAMICLIWVSHLSVSPAHAEEKKDLPPRMITVAPEYTGVIIPEGEDVSMDLTVKNGGKADENIDITLTSVPEGWKARVKTYSFDVTGVHVPTDSTKRLTLEAEPDKGTGPGKYVFAFRAVTQDGRLASSGQVTVTVREKEQEKKTKGVNIVTSYPVLQGPTDAEFEFSLEVESKVDKDTIFNLIAQGPENWEINFKPAYERKFISSLRIKANQSQTMAVTVKPYLLAQPGQYPVKVKIASDKAKAEVDLMVVLTGTYKMEMGTADGLLSLNAYRGKEANISFYVKNTGSAAQNNVRFLSFKPENWKVEFKPERIETIEPGGMKQVEATITPADQALVGDYSVNFAMEGQKVNKNLEFRVTVRASTAWGWIGIGIIVFVIAGLVVMFVRMGRR